MGKNYSHRYNGYTAETDPTMILQQGDVRVPDDECEVDVSSLGQSLHLKTSA